MLEEYLKKTEPEYYPPVENLLDLIYEHYTENNPVEKNTVAGKAAKAKEKELEEWLRGLDGMDRLVDDYVGDKIPLWEKIMDRQGTVCCAARHPGLVRWLDRHIGQKHLACSSIWQQGKRELHITYVDGESVLKQRK